MTLEQKYLDGFTGSFRMVLGSDYSSVPTQAGIYGWFLPLRKFDNISLDDLLDIYSSADLWSDVDMPNGRINFNLEQIDLHATRVRKRDSKFADFEEDVDAAVLRRIMLSCTIFTRPLYIGKSNNLQRRCSEHVKRGPFRDRFNSWLIDSPLNGRMTIFNLMFGYIPIPDIDVFGQDNSSGSKRLETFLLDLIRPPLSKQ